MTNAQSPMGRSTSCLVIGHWDLIGHWGLGIGHSSLTGFNMAKFKPTFGGGAGGPPDVPPEFQRRGSFDDDGPRGSFSLKLIPILFAALIAIGMVYAGYFWFVRRVVVGPGEVLVLMKKDGSRSL